MPNDFKMIYRCFIQHRAKLITHCGRKYMQSGLDSFLVVQFHEYKGRTDLLLSKYGIFKEI